MRALIFLLCGLSAAAQVTITPAAANSITDRSARINMTLSSAANVYAQFGLTTSYGTRSAGGNPGTTNAVISLSGLPPASTVHYRICQTGYTPPTGCTSDQTLTTAADGDPTPIYPTAVDTTYPSSFTATYSVLPDCSDLQAQITAASTQNGNNNYLVSIPAGAFCAGKITAPVKTGANPNGTGTIVVASAGVLPPPGSRISTDYYDAGQMVTMLQASVDDGYLTWTGPNPATCRALSFQWRSDLGYWYQCATTNTWTLVSASTGYTSGSGVPSSTGCDSGGEVGRYYERSGVGRNGLYYCHSSLKWVLLDANASGSSPAPGGATIAVPAIGDSSTVTGYRFVGLYFQNLFDSYSEDNEAINLGSGATRIIFDRIIIRNQRAGGGKGIGLNGAGVALINSIVDVIGWGRYASPVVNITSGSGPFFVDNNEINGCFVTIFVNDNDPTVPRSDITVSRNRIRLQPECNPVDASWNGRSDYDTRAAIEMKRGTRIAITGNWISNYYTASLSNGSALQFTPRAGNSVGGDDNAYQMSDITIANNTFSHGSGGIDMWGQDDQWYRNPRLTTRVSISGNLWYDIDSQAYSSGGNFRAPLLYMQDGVSHLAVTNNTYYNVNGTAPALLTFTAPIGGMVFRDNIGWANMSAITGAADLVRWTSSVGWSTLCDGATTASSATFSTRLDKCVVSGTSPEYTFRGNAIVGGYSGATTAITSSIPSGNYLPGDTTTGIAALAFQDTAAANYRLKMSSAYAKYGLGADQDQIRAASGEVYNVRALSITSSGATIAYTAPDAAACTVEYGTSATVGTGTRTADAGGSRFRTVSLTGLTSGTAYYARVYCAQMAPAVSFTTH